MVDWRREQMQKSSFQCNAKGTSVLPARRLTMVRVTVLVEMPVCFLCALCAATRFHDNLEVGSVRMRCGCHVRLWAKSRATMKRKLDGRNLAELARS